MSGSGQGKSAYFKEERINPKDLKFYRCIGRKSVKVKVMETAFSSGSLGVQ